MERSQLYFVFLLFFLRYRSQQKKSFIRILCASKAQKKATSSILLSQFHLFKLYKRQKIQGIYYFLLTRNNKSLFHLIGISNKQ